MAGTEPMKPGWFHTPGRPGDRTLAQQLGGLEALQPLGKSILDVGCAEGLISIELARRGAAFVHGVEIVREHITVGNRLKDGLLNVLFEHADANHWRPQRHYDVVLLLASLHKLRNPTVAAIDFATAARETIVLRLPPENAPVIVDHRSGHERHDIGAVLYDMGFTLVEQNRRGHLGEWVGIFRRRA